MSMKRSTLAIWVICLVVSQAILFALPAKHTLSFWLNSVFLWTAFLLQFMCWQAAANVSDRLRVLRCCFWICGISYLLLQFGLCLVLAMWTALPVWLAFILNVLLLGGFLLSFYFARLSQAHAAAVEANISVHRKESNHAKTDL